MNGLNICSASSSHKRADRKERQQHKKSSKKKTGSVSTGTETDNSFLSDETRTTAKTANSSQGTYRVNSHAQASSSQQESLDDQNSIAGYSYQTNSIAESYPPRSPSRYAQSPLRFSQRVRTRPPQSEVNKSKYKGGYSTNSDGLYRTDKLAEVETNCLTTDFWTDETYGCSEARYQKRLEMEHAAQNTPRKPSNMLTKSPKGVDGLEPSVQKGQKPVLVPDATSGFPLSNLMRFVSQDPEDTNDGAPLRRILCSSVPFRNGAAPMICQDKRALPQPQEMQDPNIFQILHKHGAKVKELQMNDFEEEEPNFFVEVEALRDQLNKIRDLNEIEAESSVRRSSLVDKEMRQKPKQVPSPKSPKPQHSVDSAIESRFRAHVQRERERNQRNGAFSPKKTTPTPRLSTPQRQAQFRNRIREKIGRQNQLLNEMVTDRVLSMAGSEVGSNSMGNNTRDDFAERQSTLKTSNQGHARRVEFVDHGQQNRPHPSRHSPPKVVSHQIPTRSNNLLNVSELTDGSPDHIVSGYPTDRISPNTRNMPSRDTRPTRHNDEKKGDFYQSDNGYYGKPQSPPRIENKVSSHQRDNSMEREKFDETFWKEDSSDINTAAFEQFGSEIDSVFDDLRSASSIQEFNPKSTKEIFDSFERNYQNSFGPANNDGQSKPANSNQRFAIEFDATKPKGSRTTYL